MQWTGHRAFCLHFCLVFLIAHIAVLLPTEAPGFQAKMDRGLNEIAMQQINLYEVWRIQRAYQYKRLSFLGKMCQRLANSLVTVVDGMPG